MASSLMRTSRRLGSMRCHAMPALSLPPSALAGVEDQGKKRAPMSNVDCILLAAAFSVEGVLNKLDLLHLHDNQIGAQGMACLVAAMQCGTSDCLKALGQLHLTGNPIGDIGIKQLANAIER